MSGFLSRWSRRKAASRAVAPLEAVEEPRELPPVESLGADSDYTVFLARGVSQIAQAQALRVAWASDPAIANFRGMAEYAWDFNAPGYGELSAGDNAAEWLSQIVRSGAELASTVQPTPIAIAEPEAAAPSPVTLSAEAEPLAELPEPAVETPSPPPVRRRHGGAVPV